jgi:hypothetical protein
MIISPYSEVSTCTGKKASRQTCASLSNSSASPLRKGTETRCINSPVAAFPDSAFLRMTRKARFYLNLRTC